MNATFTDIRTLGARGDGRHDDAAIINAAMQNGNRRLFIPDGAYLLGSALRLRSGAQLHASAGACFRLAAGAQKGRRDFLLTNAEEDGVTEDISVSGGVWDANSMENDRGEDLFDPQATSGALGSFRGVRRLSLSDMTLKNPLCYYLRFCEAEDVKLENLIFDSEDLHINQDGVHLAGFCKNFVMRNLYGRRGSPGDDFIALNADDCLIRQESFDMINGPQKNILIENVHAEDCHCFVRLLSVQSTIEDVIVRNVSGSCRGNAINMDASRYCRVPLFGPEDKICENGVGRLKNIRFEDMRVGRLAPTVEPYITAETNAENLEIRRFSARTPCGGETLRIANLAPHRIRYQSDTADVTETLAQKETRVFDDLSFYALTMRGAEREK